MIYLAEKLKATLRYIVSVSLALIIGQAFLPSGVLAQVIVTDTIPKKRMFSPTMVSVGLEMTYLARNIIGEDRSGYQVRVETDVYRYNLVAETGVEQFDYGNSMYSLNSRGTYWKFGIDANLMPRDVYGSMLFIGLRYAKSEYNEEVSSIQGYNQWDTVSFSAANPNMAARWIELTAGMKARVWKQLVLGYTARLKFSLKYDQSEELESYRIPGYGLARSNSFWELNYYVAWRFRWKQKYAPPAKVK